MTLMPSRRLLLLSFCTLSTRRVISTQSSCNLHKRIVNAVRGAFVADAASMGTHWHYRYVTEMCVFTLECSMLTFSLPERCSVPELLALLPDATAPEFQDPPTPNFYDSQDFPGHYHAGMLSPYGEQLLFVAEYCASNKDVDPETMSAAMYEWAKTFGGRPDHATVQFMENMSKEDKSGQWPNCGADDEQGICSKCFVFHFCTTVSVFSTFLVNSSLFHEGCTHNVYVCW